MNIKSNGAIIELSTKELETLYNLLQTVDITKHWYDRGCDYDQVSIGMNMLSTIREYLTKKHIR